MSCSVIIFSYRGRHSVNGRIEQARVSGAGRSQRTEVWVQPDARGGVFALHASGANPYFRPDELVALVYQEDTGAILKARFFSSSGQQEGAYNDPNIFWSVFGGAVSLFIAFGAIRQQRRDPEGKEQNRRQASGIDSAVDTRSLLRLSRATREDREK